MDSLFTNAVFMRYALDAIKAHVPEVNLSHGLCPACARKLYPDHSD